ncbi:PucR family transcriptional regulator [Streptomyces sp. AK02-01A]|uniref:PucR family transcriptional regulator n=1 Tax=Streptomyces sp. AK02-01A TaxID=3028648 RepID=UPI0029B2BA7B|nr:PucR family transcriptional regulator [Streptomyces sp. AK02-01A]MDX3849224.1 PucR family transcriptional regulator [Streptomyces sp. AK02-01A]
MPDPTASQPTPPTPPIPLAALLADTRLGLRRIAGPSDDGAEAAGSTAVHWVHTSEMADPYPYLLGGELLLTAGVQLTDAHADTYAARVVEAGAAALGFGVTPVYDTVPAALVEACDRHGLPLLEVPPRTPFTAVARGVWRLMAEARHRELRRVTQAQQGLAAAAARQDPVPSVLRQLAVRLGGHVVLFAPDGTELHATGRAPAPAARTALARLAGVVTPAPRAAPSGATGVGRVGGGGSTAPASATDTADGGRLAAFALGGGQGLVLGVATEGREAGDHTITGIAVVLLSLLTTPHQGAPEAGRSAALVRLLLGASPEETAPLLGPGPWTVVHARGGGTPFAAGALAAALGSSLFETDGGSVRVLTDRGVTPQPGWTLGVSGPAAPAELAAADTRAARALRRAEATRADLVRHRETAAGTGLDGLFDADEAASHARARLAPLAGSPALVETLRAWLSLHGGWDRTAVALAVHRNTVRQRIARCAALLDADLDDADVRMELWFALRRV